MLSLEKTAQLYGNVMKIIEYELKVDILDFLLVDLNFLVLNCKRYNFESRKINSNNRML